MNRDWIKVPLAKLGTLVSGGTPNRGTPRYWGGDVPWVSAKDLKSFWLADSIEHVTQEGSRNGTRVVPVGAILVLVRGMTLMKDVPIGVTTRPMAFNQDLRAILPNSEINGTYLGFWLAAHRHRLMTYVDQAGHGTGRLASEALESLDVDVPSRAEQATIVKVIQHWDTAVESTAKLIKLKRRIKHGLMQQLLTGRRRFPEFADQSWREVRLREVAEAACIRNRGTLGREMVKAVTKASGMTPMKRDLIASSIERYQVVQRDSFAYNPMRLNIGSIARWRGDGDVLVSPDYVVFRCKHGELDPDYLDQFRRSHAWSSFMSACGNGSVRVRIWFDDLGVMKLKLPPLAEQRKIAAVLDTADREIELLEQQLAALREQKNGLMQKLLTGRVRVNGDSLKVEER